MVLRRLEMTLCCPPAHGRLLLLMNLVRHKTLHTLKSKHDEQLNQSLLNRLKNLSVIGAKRSEPPARASEPEDESSLPPRRLTMEKLYKLITFYQSDPLTWSPGVLARIFNIPEDYCRKLAVYVRPMVHYNKNTGEGDVKLIPTSYVVDVARLKSDENYLVTYRRIVFPESKQKLPKRALPEISD